MRTSYEISERARKKLYESDLENLKKSDWPPTQYSSMVVGGRFVNPFSHYRPQTVFEFLYCRITELFHARPRGGVPADPEIIKRDLPTRKPDFELLFGLAKEHSPLHRLPELNQRMTLTWLGQSCAFVQLAGLNVMTDPCLGQHLVSEYVGPKRISPAPCQIEDLPPMDLVLVSHDHPDHLELETAEKIGNRALWVVPTGVKKHLMDCGIENVQEMDWWQKIRLPGTDPSDGWEIACTPAMHWSGRKMVDSNSTLWASFLVLRHGKPVFFHAGDTGYSPDLFNGIRRVFGGGCKVALLPCGAYTPRWHLRPQHIDPYEAVQVMDDLDASKMVGVHWGTFVLSDEHYLEPRDKLHELAHKANKHNDIIAPEFGRTLVFNIDDNHDDRHEKTYIRDGNALLLD
ncbi:N-acyl-phosphatidylethanolamine-hydrolyzing phospholipase D, mitochondrial [Trichomonascus vanleenenianus]|uniref:MBL fold metallo-hydrolase n=1 Tax=Trichomonascus vanleenenianus TaxID=2268995 RepID=UPI003ECB2A00